VWRGAEPAQATRAAEVARDATSPDTRAGSDDRRSRGSPLALLVPGVLLHGAATLRPAIRAARTAARDGGLGSQFCRRLAILAQLAAAKSSHLYVLYVSGAGLLVSFLVTCGHTHGQRPWPTRLSSARFRSASYMGLCVKHTSASRPVERDALSAPIVRSAHHAASRTRLRRIRRCNRLAALEPGARDSVTRLTLFTDVTTSAFARGFSATTVALW